jgi:pyrroline-5-carboxylate reductase
MTKLVVLGGGNMGAALVGGLLRSGWATPGELAVIEVVAARRAQLTTEFPGVAVRGDAPAQPFAGALLAVKPGDVPAACALVRSVGVGRVLSVAAGVTTAAIEAALGAPLPVVRAMPNTPALVGVGAAAIAPGTHAGDDDLTWAEGILQAVGKVVRVKEPLLDAVTGLSGSGPAYLFLVAEALVEGGVAAGLPRDVADVLTRQLFAGVAAMLADPMARPEVLRAGVTSPGGTTAAGLRALERGGVRSSLLEAVIAATERSRELGQ